MAKKVVASLQSKDGRAYTKVIKMCKSAKTGAYVFEEKVFLNEEAKAYANS